MTYLLLILGLLYLPLFASEQTVCEGNIEVIEVYEVIPTRSGRTLITADIKVNENSFSCNLLNKHLSKRILEDILKQKTSIELGIEKQYFKTGVSYYAEYIYPDDLWYITSVLTQRQKQSHVIIRLK